MFLTKNKTIIIIFCLTCLSVFAESDMEIEYKKSVEYIHSKLNTSENDKEMLMKYNKTNTTKGELEYITKESLTNEFNEHKTNYKDGIIETDKITKKVQNFNPRNISGEQMINYETMKKDANSFINNEKKTNKEELSINRSINKINEKKFIRKENNEYIDELREKYSKESITNTSNEMENIYADTDMKTYEKEYEVESDLKNKKGFLYMDKASYSYVSNKTNTAKGSSSSQMNNAIKKSDLFAKLNNESQRKLLSFANAGSVEASKEKYGIFVQNQRDAFNRESANNSMKNIGESFKALGEIGEEVGNLIMSPQTSKAGDIVRKVTSDLIRNGKMIIGVKDEPKFGEEKENENGKK